jgi:hypothetical protein
MQPNVNVLKRLLSVVPDFPAQIVLGVEGHVREKGPRYEDEGSQGAFFDRDAFKKDAGRPQGCSTRPDKLKKKPNRRESSGGIRGQLPDLGEVARALMRRWHTLHARDQYGGDSSAWLQSSHYATRAAKRRRLNDVD